MVELSLLKYDHRALARQASAHVIRVQDGSLALFADTAALESGTADTVMVYKIPKF